MAEPAPTVAALRAEFAVVVEQAGRAVASEPDRVSGYGWPIE